jgi:metal-dependent amidase/aminoacylase/carboxypeptidase family protein
MVNAIPGRVELESYVRGKSFEAIATANKQVNRAFTGAALSLNTNVEIIDIPGYAPEQNDKGMMQLCVQALHEILPDARINQSPTISTGSTDMGDLSRIMPTVQPYIGGAVGTSHGNDYYITDPERACVNSGKWQLAMTKLLLEDGAARAKKILADFKPEFPTAKAYLDYIDSLNTSGQRIRTLDDETLTVKI